MLDATLVAIAEHGLVPSVQASRMTLAAAPEALQGAVAAGILGCGSVILGAAEAAARLFDDVRAPQGRRAGIEDAARAAHRGARAARRPIAGYGHPLHKQADPRVATPACGRGRSRRCPARHIEIARGDRARCCPKSPASRWR